MTLCVMTCPGLAWAQSEGESFPPPKVPPTVKATKSVDRIQVDGRLNEPVWKEAPVVREFTRMEPRQGGTYYDVPETILVDRSNKQQKQKNEQYERNI